MFETDGYTVLRRFVPRDLCGFLSANYRLLVDNGQMTYDDGQVEQGYAAYGLAVSETLLGMFTEPLSHALEVPILPSYSYTRFYLKGAELKRHKDRPSCEISVTLTIDHAGPRPWPIFIESGAGESLAIELERGDILVYKGAERPHWRRPLTDDWQAQVFLHFVCRDGPYATFRYDTRPRLGAPIESRTFTQPPPKMRLGEAS